jgi:hypothetical protein
VCKPANEGGQRCASHTRRALNRAIDAFEAFAGPETFDAIQHARAEYAATPSGARRLTRRLDSLAPNAPEAIDLSEALRRGASIRERNAEVAALRKARGSLPERRALASATSTPGTVLETLYFTDPEPSVRDLALRNPGATPAMRRHASTLVA